MTEHASSKGNTRNHVGGKKSVQTSLRDIAHKAEDEPEHRFRNLYGMINKELLTLAWRRLNKKATAGVDRVTAQEYGRNLDENLENLIDRLKRNAYRAKLVKRVRIPKGNGKTRELGVPTLEDRLLQKAVAMILEAVYDRGFLEGSYGYRPNRNPNMAVNDFRDALNFGRFTHVVEADIKGFFDHIDHGKLIEMLELRINDKKLIRLLKKWLNAGILDTDGKVIHPLTGTPQGGIVSPILANVYLHYALDLWVDKVVAEQIGAPIKYVRFADDFVCAFSSREHAERFYRKLPKRLAKFNLEVAREKTYITPFRRFGGKENGRINFLGFELYWGKDRKGGRNLKRRTGRKRMRRALKDMGVWLKENRHLKEDVLIKSFNSKLTGHYNYFGVIGNSKSIGAVYHHAKRLLFKWLNKRSQKKSMTWARFTKRIEKRLSKPRVKEQKILQRKLPGIRC